MTFQLSDATRAVLDELERMRLSEERASDSENGYNEWRRYELPIVESQRPRLERSYRSGRGPLHLRGMSS